MREAPADARIINCYYTMCWRNASYLSVPRVYCTNVIAMNHYTLQESDTTVVRLPFSYDLVNKDGEATRRVVRWLPPGTHRLVSIRLMDLGERFYQHPLEQMELLRLRQCTLAKYQGPEYRQRRHAFAPMSANKLFKITSLLQALIACIQRIPEPLANIPVHARATIFSLQFVDRASNKWYKANLENWDAQSWSRLILDCFLPAWQQARAVGL